MASLFNSFVLVSAELAMELAVVVASAIGVTFSSVCGVRYYRKHSNKMRQRAYESYLNSTRANNAAPVSPASSSSRPVLGFSSP